MKKDKFDYRKRVTFINRRQELKFLEDYVNEEPDSMLFLHGPKSSGKTTPQGKSYGWGIKLYFENIT